jgi:hypothetical protein
MHQYIFSWNRYYSSKNHFDKHIVLCISSSQLLKASIKWWSLTLRIHCLLPILKRCFLQLWLNINNDIVRKRFEKKLKSLNFFFNSSMSQPEKETSLDHFFYIRPEVHYYDVYNPHISDHFFWYPVHAQRSKPIVKKNHSIPTFNSVDFSNWPRK